jgi:GT2 family glycosyltransferase
MSFGYSVVVPTTMKNWEFLNPCLKSIQEQSEGTVEIVVVVNGKDENMSATLRTLYPDVKLVEVEKRVGYSEACNIGIAAATGKHVIITNDDVLVGPDWNVALMTCMTKFQEDFPQCPPAAIVGPSSNNVAGVQQIPNPQVITPENYIQACAEIKEANERNWVPSAFISGFCMMISREFIDLMDGKPFDERLVNGAEDNFAVQQAMFRGYSAVACGEAFVYHYGSKTTDRLLDEETNARGVRNLFDFYRYGQELIDNDNQKVAACCRARLLTEGHLRVFKMAVAKNVTLADALVVLNDRSDKKLWQQAATFCIAQCAQAGDIPFIHRTNHGRKPLNECEDRQWLLDQAREEVGDINGWYLSFDADEVFEDKFDSEYIQKLIRPPHPMIISYLFHFYTFWDEAETMWRKDGTFGQMAGHRLVRILPGQNMLVTESGMHMGNVPMCRVVGGGADTSIRIKHYGFTTQEERQRKYDFYTEYDTVKDVEQIGHADYRHLIAQKVELQQWVEDTSLTIGTCMRNEEIGLHNWLRSFWAFADELIVTDTGSTDRTVALLKMWGATVIDYDEVSDEPWDPTFATRGADLGRARNFSLHSAETYWYWQIDPDEHPRPSEKVQHPLAYMRRQLDRTDLDAMQFFFRCIQPQGYHTLSQTPRLISRPKERAYFGYVHETLDPGLPSTSNVDYSHLDFIHTGGIVGEEAYHEKMKRYFRANLRMIQDYPEEARGWFNSAMHFLDSPHPAMRATGIMFMGQAQIRNPEFVVAVKEIAVQAFTDLKEQLGRVLSLTPPGHPFYDYATRAIQACNEFGLESRDMIRCPGHAEEVLKEEAFAEFAEIVNEQAKLYAPGGEYSGSKAEAVSDLPDSPSGSS